MYQQLEVIHLIIGFGTTLANSRDELRNGRAEMIRATGAVLIASVLLYLCSLAQVYSVTNQTQIKT